MGNLAGWPYWKVISITGQAGSGTDYQVKLTIGDSAGGDFHLEGHCTNFPQDIRITDDDGTTLLDHWVEDLTADPIVVHVEVKDDLGSNQTIRVYYGKNGETTASNGVNTFITFDDFEGAVIDSGIWDQSISGVTTSTDYTFQGSKSAKFTTAGDLWGTLAHSDNIAFKYWAYYSSAPNVVYPFLHGDDVSRLYVMVGDPGAGDISYHDGSWQDTGVNVLTSQWAPFEARNFVWASHTQDILYNGVEIASDVGQRSGDGYNDDLRLLAAGTAFYADCFLVRKYNSPEPAFSSAGAEQTPTVTGHPWYYRRNQ